MEFNQAKIFAEKNRKKVVKLIPNYLAKKEDKFIGKMIKAKVNPIRKLEYLYSLMHELSEYVLSYTPCKKGCSSCCYYNVTISEIELKYIEQKTKRKRSKKLLPKKVFHGLPCSFLENNVCSIYEARPFVCRRHIMLTDSDFWCAANRCNDEVFPLLGFTSVDETYDLIRNESNSFQLWDIRQLFDYKT